MELPLLERLVHEDLYLHEPPASRILVRDVDDEAPGSATYTCWSLELPDVEGATVAAEFEEKVNEQGHARLDAQGPPEGVRLGSAKRACTGKFYACCAGGATAG
ncbi:hypothetical protein WME94_44270 [Sorangium sp. So ce429]